MNRLLISRTINVQVNTKTDEKMKNEHKDEKEINTHVPHYSWVGHSRVRLFADFSRENK